MAVCIISATGGRSCTEAGEIGEFAELSGPVVAVVVVDVVVADRAAHAARPLGLLLLLPRCIVKEEV